MSEKKWPDTWPPMTHIHPDGFGCWTCMEERARLTRERDEARAAITDTVAIAHGMGQESAMDRIRAAEAEVERLTKERDRAVIAKEGYRLAWKDAQADFERLRADLEGVATQRDEANREYRSLYLAFRDKDAEVERLRAALREIAECEDLENRWSATRARDVLGEK